MKFAGYAIAALLAYIPSYAYAQQQACAPYAKVVSDLAEQFHEVPFMQYASPRMHGLVVIFAAPNEKTTTVFLVRGDTACAIDSGENFAPAEAPGKDS
jgi:hypothetical protein